MHDAPLRISKAPSGGIWEEFRLYRGHLELDTVLGTLVIPFEQIDRVTRAATGRADESEIVIIDRSDGAFRRVMIRPAPGFGDTLEEALGLFRKNLTDH